jgi:hypothetical protein
MATSKLSCFALLVSVVGCASDDDGSGTGESTGASGGSLAAPGGQQAGAGGGAGATTGGGGTAGASVQSPDSGGASPGGAWVWPPVPGEATCGLPVGDDGVGDPDENCRNTSFPEGGECYTCAVDHCCRLLMCAGADTGLVGAPLGSRFEAAYRYIECVDECLAENAGGSGEDDETRLENCAEGCARSHDFGYPADYVVENGTLFDARSLVRCLADLPLDLRVAREVAASTLPGGCPVCLPHL